MIDKTNAELKLIREKVNEIEEEMSVSTKNNIYFEDIKKSRKLLVYRYALLLQIKDIARMRSKISTRVEKIKHLKSQSARGRILTEREQEAIYNLKNDIRKREDIIELYDDKKGLYSDKRLAYYGIDDMLINTFIKHAEEFYPFFEVTEKNVYSLKNTLDEMHNFKHDKMNKEEIVVLNTNRYGDEIVDFELGINFSDEAVPQIVEFTIESVKPKFQTPNKSKLELLESKIEGILNEKSKIKLEEKLEKDNFIMTESGELIDANKAIIESKSKDEVKKEDSLSKAKNINDLSSSKYAIKTVKSIKDKILLKDRLEEYINNKENVDVARDDYNNFLIKCDLSNDEEVYKLELLLTNDIYQLGILMMLKDELKELEKKANQRKNRKNKTQFEDMISKLSDEIQQLMMQYNCFPGHSFNDVKEYNPEKVEDALKKFMKDSTSLDLTNMYKAAIDFTFTSEGVRKKYEEFYCAKKNIDLKEDEESSYFNHTNDDMNN